MDEVKALTAEEKRVEIYAEKEPPINPSEVKKDTPLKELNLSWTEKELPEYKRTKHVHRLHPYLGKFIPQLVEVFLRKYFTPGQTVLDPFVGSGTTLVQANELGINAIGYDISAFNVLLSRAKTAKYDTQLLESEIIDIYEKTKNITSNQLGLDKICQKYDVQLTTDSEYLNNWFAPQALSELLVYLSLIPNYYYQDILKVILSRSARSARQTTHFDLDFPKEPQKEPYWCYKHSRNCKPVQTAMKFINRYSSDTFKRIKEYSKLQAKNMESEVYHEDIVDAKIPKVDGVITSPPYVGLIDYHEQHRYAYELLGLEDKSAKEVGPAKKGASKKACQEYQKILGDIFEKISGSIPDGGYVIVVAGDKYGLYDNICEFAGLKTEAVVKRHVNRRTGRRNGEFYESVFIWRK